MRVKCILVMALTPAQLRELRRSTPEKTGNRVAKAMELAGLNQAELAERINVTQPYVSDVARGRYPGISVPNAYKFAEFFGCSIEDLFPVKSQVA